MRGRCACRVNLAGVADHSAELEAMNLACPTEFTPADRIAFRTQLPDGRVLCNVFAAEGTGGVLRLNHVSVGRIAYEPSLWVTSGPQFNSDEAGDGPARGTSLTVRAQRRNWNGQIAKDFALVADQRVPHLL